MLSGDEYRLQRHQAAMNIPDLSCIKVMSALAMKILGSRLHNSEFPLALEEISVSPQFDGASDLGDLFPSAETLARCNSVQRLRYTNSWHPDFSVPAPPVGSVPMLKFFRGPSHQVAQWVEGRPVEGIDLLWTNQLHLGSLLMIMS